MAANDPADSTAAMEYLLAEIVDCDEKLDVVVHLHCVGFAAHTTHMIAHALRIPGLAVAQALSALAHAGIVTTVNEDGAGWTIDPFTGWDRIIASIARLHDRDRLGVLRRIASLALRRTRARAAGEIADVITIHGRPECSWA